MSTAPKLPPLSLYIHVPFCVKKCPYCDFHSTVEKQIPEDGYLATIKNELVHWRHKLCNDNRPLHSIFFGGGTPSILTGETIIQLLKEIRQLWQLTPQCEITLESNPESCHPQKIEQWLLAGVNRLSIGIQAFNQQRLDNLGRPHSLVEASKAIEYSQQGGFSNLNLDLIFATPSQTTAGWQDELAQAMSCQPKHLSCYSLTIEKETPFATLQQQGKITELSEDEQLELFTTTRQILESGGWHGYEISNFAKPGWECQHNINYWQSSDYIGVGPSAHGRLSQIDNNMITVARYVNRTRDYLEKQSSDGSSFSEERICSKRESGNDCLIMGLRLNEGMSRKTYRYLRGIDLVEQQPKAINELQKAGLLTVTKEKIALTNKGLLLSDGVIEKLIWVD
ncbi:MAG: radical SAM family heme chaperone HemW [Magnetococcales bacterium]|nr:radical SAM family heme chaperone HemW [Magnetococcales bacterium]